MGTDIAKIHRLAEQILYHKRLYYTGNPQISDYEYDKLENELRQLDPEHPVLKLVGFEIEKTQNNEVLKKAEHIIPMLSLDKTYDIDDLKKWIGDKQVVGNWKIDGNSLAVIYYKGKLIQAKTRGNGRVGEDVTDKVLWVSEIIRNIDLNIIQEQLCSDIDLTLLKESFLEIRGELYCTTQNFLLLCDEMVNYGFQRPTSPRNIVAGLLGRKGYSFLTRYFSFAAFDMLVLLSDGVTLMQEFSDILGFEMRKLNLLNKLGFSTPGYRLLEGNEQVLQYLNYIKTLMEDDEFGIDGAVFTFNDLSLHKILGATAHHPRYKLAFKWQGQTAVSTIQRIQWSTSRLGIVTPVAIIEPVHLSGATITNITLHNLAHVKAYRIKPNDKIEIVRSGEVIPKFLRIVKSDPNTQCQWPKYCPSCNSELIDDGIRLICPNVEACPAQKGRSILNWIHTVGIEDLSEKRLDYMLSLGLVKNIPDLYRLTLDDLKKLPLTKDKMAQKLYTNIQKTKTLPLAVFLSGLGIPHVGRTTWEKLLYYYKTLDELLSATVEDIAKIDGFALKSAQQIVNGLSFKNSLITELLQVGVIPFVSKQDADNSQTSIFQGKQFVITGELSQSRSYYESLIKSLGGKLASAVSKNTYALICNDLDSKSTKMKKALALNIPIWSEKQFLDFVDKSNGK